jgi:hypothetical protein
VKEPFKIVIKDAQEPEAKNIEKETSAKALSKETLEALNESNQKIMTITKCPHTNRKHYAKVSFKFDLI